MIKYIIFSMLSLSSVWAKNCPSRMVNDTNVDYKVKERFDALIKDHPKVIVRHTHIRRGGEEYEYTINFCGDVSNDAVIQKSIKDGKVEDSTRTVAGKADNKALITGGENWMMVQYFNGKPYGGHCGGDKRQSWVFISCEDEGKKEELRVIEEARINNNKDVSGTCYYLFELNSRAVCAPHEKKLSGGAIFCIILFVFALAYLLFGFAYQRFIAGAKGLEQIPNYAFWRKVGNLSADGCDFVCRRDDGPHTYKGMADALDIDTSDDEKDDGLLPM